MLRLMLLHLAIVLLVTAAVLPSRILAQNQSSDRMSQPPGEAAPENATSDEEQQNALKPQAYYPIQRRWFPDIFSPYRPMADMQPMFTNSPRIEQLVQDSKLMLSLADAITLSIENNLAIDVERYNPWLDEAGLLRAKSGINGLLPAWCRFRRFPHCSYVIPGLNPYVHMQPKIRLSEAVRERRDSDRSISCRKTILLYTVAT